MNLIMAKQEALNLLESLVKLHPALIDDNDHEIDSKSLINLIVLSLAMKKNLKMYLTKGE